MVPRSVVRYYGSDFFEKVQHPRIRHFGNVPIANFAVFFHNSFFSISAVEIIYEGTMQRLVCKGRDDQRSSFNQPLNDWDVSNVDHMYVFDGATSFNQPLHAPWYRE